MKIARLSQLAAIATLLPIVSHAEDDWHTLFNGQDLTGWTSISDEPGFSVVDGTIRANASSEKLDHLFYTGDEGEELVRFKNFELELFARSEPNSNSGIFFHTDKTISNKSRMFLGSGYEVQLNSTEKEKRKTGSLYDVVDLDESVVDETNWFRVNIVVNGKRIIVKIDGEQVIDYTEPENPKRSEKRRGRVLSPDGGAIALQAHDPDSTFYFKDIRIRRLP
ncbi:MAG: DUF1080 domain-containing protein [Verrucomicrobiota bacterium]